MKEEWSRVLFSRVAVCERGVARTMGRQAVQGGVGIKEQRGRSFAG
jgi:hypothetical protein